MGIFHEAPVPLAGLCLLMALLSFVTGVYAWLPFAHHASSVLFPMHLATMAVLFCVFLQVFRHNVIAFGHRKFAFPRVSLPRTYWAVLSLSCVGDRKSTRLNSSHPSISYAVFCLKKKNNSNR